MNTFSLATIIDDILLIVRNNNISESEDFSRAQIAAWVMHYKSALLKQKLDEIGEDSESDDLRDSVAKVIGPLKLKKVESLDCNQLFKRETVREFDDIFDNNPSNIIAVFDQEHCPIQAMNGIRRHFHYFRKYTARELTYDFENKHIVISGNSDCNKLEYIWVKYIVQDDTEADEEDITVPGWMIPTIKELIFKNELSFMIKMPSDDDNNSTLDGIKPHGPQDQEK